MPKDIESEWAKTNPEPQTVVTDDLLTLWNYPVNKAELATAHLEAIAKFAQIAYVFDPGGSRCRFGVSGHTSKSGSEEGNNELSRRRAQSVADYLHKLGVASVEVDWHGSGSPVNATETGLGYARNRRVEVFKFQKLAEFVPAPLDPEDTPRRGQVPKSNKLSTPDFFGGFEQEFEADLGKWTTANVVMAFSVKGKLSIQVKGKNGSTGAKAILNDKKLSIEFEKQLTEGLKASLGVEPAAGGKPAKLKLGVQAEKALLAPKIELQGDIKFIAVSFEICKAALPEIVIGDVTVTIDFTGEITGEFGPSPALVTRLGRFAAPAAKAAAPVAAQAAVAVGVIAAAAVINGGTAYLSQMAQAEGLRYAEELALRDGAASRVAYEVLGQEVQARFEERRLEWRKLEGGTLNAFQKGISAVNGLLKKIGSEERITRRQKWNDVYAQGTKDFTEVRERVFLVVGGYERSGSDISKAISEL